LVIKAVASAVVGAGGGAMLTSGAGANCKNWYPFPGFVIV
jgi:hypothetical protein